MNTYSLDGVWKLRIIGENVYDIPDTFIEAKVPGTVYTTLVEEGLMPDPFYRDNELQATKLSENDFEYVKSFEVTAEQLAADEVDLVFDGIDTLADVFLNDHLLGHVENMHCSYRFSAKEYLQEGSNELQVHIFSPIRYIKEENEKVYTGGSGDAMEGYPHLRKAHCMFGWDWGPRLPDAGVFRSVRLELVEQARLSQVQIRQVHEEDQVTLCVAAAVEKAVQKAADSFVLSVIVADEHGQICANAQFTDMTGQLVIEHPDLWWPNGYGRQPLYTVTVVLLSWESGKVLDSWEKRIGLRTMTVDTKQDQWGNCFAHCVNGLDIFAMGADYIPEDNLFGRISRERTERLLRDCVAANYNSIRIWGGGYYPEDYFYDLCDELGLVVWQDFMFACSSYELDDAFEANITEEITQNIRRLRHHACLGLWCGNNEMETQTLDGAWRPSQKQKLDYIKIFEYIIPKIVKREDPDAFYWPSSPSSGGNYDNPWDENRGDTHYWDVWHGSKPFTEYRKFRFRYLSEFGFQSFPCLKTVESFTEPADRNIFSRVMEMHQRNRAANGKILDYLSQTYLYPKDFDSLLYTSQLLQMEAIRYGVEHFRRHRGQCMGAVVWQLNDIWPVASWSSIDYYGRWKALHYAERRMFAPITITCEETGELSERPSCVAERKKPIRKAAKLHVANETWDPLEAVVCWELRRPDSSIIKEGKESIHVEPFSGTWMDELDFTEQDELNCYISYRLEKEGTCLSCGTTLFAAPKHFGFVDPKLEVEVDGRELTIKAAAYAKSVEIIPVDGEARFSDNYFDMNAGMVKITVMEGDASKFAVRSVYDIA